MGDERDDAPVQVPAASGIHRRAALQLLGMGAAGIGLGGLGALAGCASSDDGHAASGPSTTTAPARKLPAYDPKVPYWEQGNFAPVTVEETLTDLEVKGSLPPELSGLFVRNGSNPPTGKSAHWFVGDGMLHGVQLEGGKARWYRNRYVETSVHEPAKPYGGPPGMDKNQSNVAVTFHAGKLLTTGEVGWPYQVDPKDLTTVGPWDFAGKLGNTMTAHPKIDPATGRMHFFGYEILEPAMTYYATDTQGRIVTATKIGLDAPTMIHDFAVTDREAVWWVGPVVFGPDPTNPIPAIPFHWNPKGRNRVAVLPFDGGPEDVRWLDIPLDYGFHGLNAHRDGDDIVIHLNRQEQAFGPKGDLLPSYLYEWRIGTAGKDLTFSSKQLSDRSMDLPTHDRRHSGRPTRHGWFTVTVPPTSDYGFELGGICHLDVKTGEEDIWDPGPSRRSGEGFFVPSGKGEGEGWVMTFVWDRTTNLSSFAVFDAQAMRKGPVAEVPLPVRVPYGFHGLWVGDDEL
jgi:carotenoid cleavage dioxygenase-like enzyme